MKGRLVVEETSAGMALAHWAFPDGEKFGLGLLLSLERYRDPEQRLAWETFLRQQAERMLAEKRECEECEGEGFIDHDDGEREVCPVCDGKGSEVIESEPITPDPFDVACDAARRGKRRF